MASTTFCRLANCAEPQSLRDYTWISLRKFSKGRNLTIHSCLQLVKMRCSFFKNFLEPQLYCLLFCGKIFGYIDFQHDPVYKYWVTCLLFSFSPVHSFECYKPKLSSEFLKASQTYSFEMNSKGRIITKYTLVSHKWGHLLYPERKFVLSVAMAYVVYCLKRILHPIVR